MPIFDYECSHCGNRIDVLQKLGEGARRKCPACGRLTLRKCMSAPTFHLRGSGWRKPSKGGKGSGEAPRRVPRIAHTLDSGAAHTHDDPVPAAGSGGGGHGHGHGSDAHSHGGHSHSHGGHTHTHGSGQKHTHKH